MGLPLLILAALRHRAHRKPTRDHSSRPFWHFELVATLASPPLEHRLAPQVVVDEMEAGGFTAEIHELRLERQYIIVAIVE